MYKKLIETKVVRVTHEVSFSEGTQAVDLIDSLKSVPLHSFVTDVETDDDTGTTSIFFREEKVEP
jgi:hypothetical protein